ncbi:acyl-CoA dehydrogenase family protein [Nocardioides sp. TRM66260-LWL]|uniref:acyl-CoA dehydrogenase family protein n=1 Tax=Nocardioides sp. TRM66260-LWL TaxID=2874478 RepID=UPI001CC3C96C|nr:acyl-CoA dehydrogenase family protein [Nocardioides sp. TRM66260-LWL]MBZ5734491.1 acyl-CoA dehydrogenase family protein [Nocardioides sp. TRM66260-LWL]
MDFTYDDEQDALREAVRGLVGKAYSDFEHRRQTVLAEPGYSEDLWRQLAEMGILGLPFAEADGGSGAGPVEVAIVAQELGRVIAPEPFLASIVLAGGLVSAVGTAEQRADVLGALSSGERLVVLAHAEPGSGRANAACEVTATQDGDSWTLTGIKEPVPHGARADQLVVSAALPGGGTGLFLVDPSADGVERTGYAAFDGTRAAKVALASAPATPLGEPGADVEGSIATVHDIARIIAGNQAVGALETALRTTTGYLTSRKQFGVTLNTFQALTFRASDMYVSLELTTSLVLWATMVLAEGDPQAVHAAAARAGLQVARASRHIGQEAIQLHGGIGVTAEYSIGSYTAHLQALEQLLGDATFHLRTLAGTVAEHGTLEPV